MKYREFKNVWEPGFIPPGPGVPNTVALWAGSDTEENFRKNPAPGYDESSISYVYNNYGFRSDDFEFESGEKNILYIGCSFTQGVGLRWEDTWVHKVSKEFPEHRCYNLGFGGLGPDYVARIATNIIPIAKPDIVFVFWPSQTRFEFWVDAGLDDCVAEVVMPYWCKPAHAFLFDDANMFQNKKRAESTLHQLCDLYNCTLVELHFEEMESEFAGMPPMAGSARDNHWSPANHTYMAKRFTDLYYNTIQNTL